MNVVVYFLSLIILTSAEEWGYLKENGPSHWSETNPICSDVSESPVNIITGQTQYDSGLTPFTFTGYYTLPAGAEYTLENNGHSAEVHLSAHSKDAYSVSGGGLPTTYHADQFHFHWGRRNNRGSEHKVNGRAYPMEMHIVHHSSLYPSISEAVDKDQGLAVLGFFFMIGKKDNPAVDAIVNHLPSITRNGDEVELEPFVLSSLFPSNMTSYWRYAGSLTTPPCAESVIWTVFKTPIEISAKQLAKFRTLYFGGHPPVHMQDNFRPAQPLNGRTVYSSDRGVREQKPDHLLKLLSMVKSELI